MATAAHVGWARAFEWVFLTPNIRDCVAVHTGVDGPGRRDGQSRPFPAVRPASHDALYKVRHRLFNQPDETCGFDAFIPDTGSSST